jgi:hypothetical protein
VVKLYPQSVGLDRFRSLVASLAHGRHLELGADLLRFALPFARGRSAAPVRASPAAPAGGVLSDIAEPELLALVHAQLRAYAGQLIEKSLRLHYRF